MISKLGANPFLRRQQVESEAGEAGKKSAVGRTLPRPPAGTATGTKSVAGSDHFESARGGGLFATAFARPAQGAPADERTLPGRVDRGFAEGAIEPYLDAAAALAGGGQSSELRSLVEQLKQLTAEKRALREAIAGIAAQILELETELGMQGESGFDLEKFLAGDSGAAPADPRLAELMRTLGQHRDRLAAIDEEIAGLMNQIEKMSDEPQEEVRIHEDLPDLRGATAPAGDQPIASARHLRHAVSFGDEDP